MATGQLPLFSMSGSSTGGGGSSSNFNLGGAISDLFGGAKDMLSGMASASGSYAAGNAYQSAAAVTREETAMGLHLANTQIGLTQGTVKANTAGAGFQLSGSAQDVIRMNAKEGALSKAAIQQQGLMQETSYNAQWKAANSAAHGQEGGGMLSTLESVAMVAAMFL